MSICPKLLQAAVIVLKVMSNYRARGHTDNILTTVLFSLIQKIVIYALNTTDADSNNTWLFFFFKLYLKTHKKTFETSANHSGIGQGRCILLLLICLCVGQVNSGLHFLFIKLAATPHSTDNSSMYE